MAERLRYQRSLRQNVLIPPGVVVVLLVLTLDQIFAVKQVVLDRRGYNLENKGVDKVQQQIRVVNELDYPLVEVVHDMLADILGFDVLFHLLEVVIFIYFLGQFRDQLLVQERIEHFERVPHRALGKRLFVDSRLGIQLGLLN